jgi:hypothetical protein
MRRLPVASVTVDRGLLLNVAYRLLGSVSEAKDGVQETFTRWYAHLGRDLSWPDQTHLGDSQYRQTHPLVSCSSTE